MNRVPVPQGNYLPAKRHGDIIYTAGMTPRSEGVLIQQGIVTSDRALSHYKDAVVQACRNAMNAALSLLMPSETDFHLMAMTVFIASDHHFTAHARLADYASDYLAEQWGAAGKGVRTAVGVASLPGNAPVEIQLIVAATGATARH